MAERFFGDKTMKKTIKEIAQIVGGRIEGDGDTVIHGVAGIEQAGEGDITFVSNPKYIRYIESTKASAIVCSPDVSAASKTLLKVDSPYLAYAKVLRYLYPPLRESGQIDERARVGENVQLGNNVIYRSIGRTMFFTKLLPYTSIGNISLNSCKSYKLYFSLCKLKIIYSR